MKIKLFAKSGNHDTSVHLSGFTMTDFMSTYQDPELGHEAATKRYVDRFPYTLSTDIISGKPVALKNIANSISGDITVYNNTSTTLQTKLAAGSYSRVQVNSKGLITGGTLLQDDVIVPTLAYSQIQSLPTAVGSYIATPEAYVRSTAGVTSTMTGPLEVAVTPTANNQLASYGYATAGMASIIKPYKSGDIAIKPVATAPSGFLKMDGSYKNVADYPTLYGKIGTTYGSVSEPSGYGHIANPWATQTAFNSSTNPTTLSWTIGTVNLPAATSYPAFCVTKNRVYLFGGNANNSYTAAVYTATIDASGNVGAWSNTGKTLPFGWGAAKAAYIKNRIYLIGGYFMDNSSTGAQKVYSIDVDSNGAITGNFTAQTNLPSSFTNPFVTAVNGFLYVFDGGLSASAPIRCPINADGSLGAWSATGSALTGINGSIYLSTGTRIYSIGGYTASNYTQTSNIRYCTINADGSLSGWLSGGAMPIALSASNNEVLVTKNRAYIFGFYNSSFALSNGVYSASIASGVLGSFSQAGTLPGLRSSAAVFATSSKVYLYGGASDTATYNNCVYATFAGGVNDYSAIIQTGSGAVTQFKLPDLSSKKDGIYEYYIKA